MDAGAVPAALPAMLPRQLPIGHTIGGQLTDQPTALTKGPHVKAFIDLTPGEAGIAELRNVALQTPQYAVEQIHHRVADHSGDGGTRADLLVLLAETYQRLGRPHFAVAAASDAIYAAKVLPSGGDSRRTLALGVAADIAVWAGDDAAVAACTAYFQAAANDKKSDQRRVKLAGALRAVAIYGVDCERGRAILARLLPMGSGGLDPTAMMIRKGYAAMQDSCDPDVELASLGPLVPMPGGVLHPGLEFPSAVYLAQRAARHPVRHHTCPSHQSA